MIQRISDPLKGNGETLGNKGKFLCRMREVGFCVPDGVILDGKEYTLFLEYNKIKEKLEQLLDGLQKDYIPEISEKLIHLFEGKHLSEELQRKLADSIDLSGHYAVRSSGTKEDLQDFSL